LGWVILRRGIVLKASVPRGQDRSYRASYDSLREPWYYVYHFLLAVEIIKASLDSRGE
jgi:hypothetical protein